MNIYTSKLVNLPYIKKFDTCKVINNGRAKDLGLLIVIGGPGGSGASTIAKMIASYFHLAYVYGGAIMRKIALRHEYSTIESFLASDFMKKNGNLVDREVDESVIKSSFKPNVLIDSKDFAAIASYKKIPCTVKVWLMADLDVRVHRKLWSSGKLPIGKTLSKRTNLYKDTSLKLMLRFSNDKNRYKKLYNIEYDKQELYNNIVIDTTHLNRSETFNLIIKLLKHGEYIK